MHDILECEGGLKCSGQPEYLIESGKKEFCLNGFFIYDYYDYRIVIPPGFICDLASIPQYIFWWQLGLWDIAAIVHDFAYYQGGLYFYNGKEVVFWEIDKNKADTIFHRMLIELGVKKRTAWLMYQAVHNFGTWKH